jgi:Flp pilus assembly pilin Flp
LLRGTPDAVSNNEVEEAGQAFVEYALILGFVALVAVATLTVMGGMVTAALDLVESALEAAVAGG